MLVVILISIALASILAEMALQGAIGSRAIRHCVSLTLSVALHGLFFMAGLAAGWPFPAVMTALLVASASFLIVFKRYLGSVLRGQIVTIDAAGTGFLFYSFCATLSFINASTRWGGWDGWAIWNMHAKFLYSGPSWTNMFSGPIAWTHSDYPILLPALIALGWKSLGTVTPVVPMLIAYAALSVVIALLYVSLRERTSPWVGLAGVVLAIDSQFIGMAASQYADTLLSLFYLITAIFLCANQDRPGNNLLIGLFAAMCMLVKNEGIAFFTVVSAVFAVRHFRKATALRQYLYGCIIPLGLVFIFKVGYSPVNDIINPANAHRAAFYECAVRGWATVKYLVSITLPQYGAMVLLVFMGMLTSFRKMVSPATVAILVTLVLYLAAYVFSPYEINWHLRSSLDRLVHQVSPSLIYLSLVAIVAQFKSGSDVRLYHQ
jgi:hypothetical protein